jgi:predicted transcriptional regulator
MEKEKLTKNEIVIAQLMDGDPMTSQDIADKVSGNGVDMDSREVSTLMNKLCKTDLGHFIKKKRKGRSLLYQVVDEARYLTPEEAYGLSLKIGKNRYPLEQALEDHPDLKKHVKRTRKKKAASEKTGTRAPAVGRGKSKSSAENGEAVKMDAEGLQSALMGLLKMVAGDGEINVKVEVTVRLEK